MSTQHGSAIDLVMRSSSLGSVPRDYEHPERFGHGKRKLTDFPQHRLDDHILYMRPDVADTLEVQAECMRHFTRLSRADVWAGVLAPCPKGDRCLKVRGYDA